MNFPPPGSPSEPQNPENNWGPPTPPEQGQGQQTPPAYGPPTHPEHTSALPPFGFHEEPQTRESHGGPGRGAAVGVLVGALLLGAAGGIGGAAAYNAQQGDSTTSTASTTTTPDSAGSTGSATPLTTDSRDTTPVQSRSPEAVAKAVLPSVVQITVVNPGGTGGSGSGIILSSDGEVLTNNHVVDLAQQGGDISVSFNDGSTSTATVVGTDPVTDLAVIKVANVSGLTPAKLGDSNRLQVGEPVVAIGSPFGLEATVTSGIVSSLNRPVSVGETQSTETTYPAIQTDAAINPGNSGGPLANMAGQVIGINSSIRTDSSTMGGSQGGSIGLGFAIPLSKVLPVVEELRNHQTPTHAKLGVTVANKVNGDGLVVGGVIQSVVPGSAADQAGVQSGDVVTKVDDQSISGLESLVATIRGYRPGDTVHLTIVRHGATKQVTATLDSDVQSSDS